MTISDMYKYAKQTIDTMVQRWDGGDLYAHYAQRDPDIAKNMLKDWRQSMPRSGLDQAD